MTRATVLATGLTLVAALVPAVPAVAADEPWTVPDNATITIDGLGFGHGRGLSQYGALGRGRAGHGYESIVKFYYPGTDWGRSGGTVKVLVTADTSTDVVVDARSRLAVRSLGSGRTFTLPAKVKQRKVIRWRITAAGGGRSQVDARTNRWREWRAVSGDAEFSAGGDPVTLRTPAGAVAYRGRLRSATPSGSGTGRDTVNVVSLDSYLKGVLPQEVIASVWPVATLRAQAVAARTYAAYERAAAPSGRHYDLCDTASCQVYGGATAEYPRTNDAVVATAGRVLTFGGEPVFAQFSASNGGYTVADPNFPYLVAQEDPFDHYDPDGVGGDGWRTSVTSAAIEKAYNLENLTGIRVAARDGLGAWGGRVVTVWLLSSTGWNGTVTGDSFRRRLGLRSTLFTISDVAPG